MVVFGLERDLVGRGLGHVDWPFVVYNLCSITDGGETKPCLKGSAWYRKGSGLSKH